jgi:hypothetical protein
MDRKADCCDLCGGYNAPIPKGKEWLFGCAKSLHGIENVTISEGEKGCFQRGYCKVKKREVICCKLCRKFMI